MLICNEPNTLLLIFFISNSVCWFVAPSKNAQTHTHTCSRILTHNWHALIGWIKMKPRRPSEYDCASDLRLMVKYFLNKFAQACSLTWLSTRNITNCPQAAYRYYYRNATVNSSFHILYNSITIIHFWFTHLTKSSTLSFTENCLLVSKGFQTNLAESCYNRGPNANSFRYWIILIFIYTCLFLKCLFFHRNFI